MTKDSPLISIIIPAYNRAHLIGETLDSIIAQTYKNWECIVVDDGSSDHTERILQNYCAKDSRFKFYHRPENHLPGGNGARNYGFEKSKGEYIQWFDSDDIMSPSKMEYQVAALQNKQVDVVFSNAIFMNTGLKWSKHLQAYKKCISDALIKNNAKIPVNSLLIKKDILNKKEIRWNEFLKGAQEWEFNIKLFYNKDITYYFMAYTLDIIRDDNYSITRDENGKKKRYNNYLLARIFILKFLKEENFDDLNKYFRFIYMDSLKFIRFLAKKNSFDNILKFGFMVWIYSKFKAFYYLLGIFSWKFFNKSYFLDKIKQ